MSAIDWQGYRRCEQCGVSAQYACRDDDDNVAAGICEGRERRRQYRRIAAVAPPKLAIKEPAHEGLRVQRILEQGRALCRVCLTRAAIDGDDVCGRAACHRSIERAIARQAVQ